MLLFTTVFLSPLLYVKEEPTVYKRDSERERVWVWKNDFGLATAGIREFLRFSRSLIKWKRLELSPLNGERAYLAVKGGRDEWISESDWKIYLGNDLELLQTDMY